MRRSVFLAGHDDVREAVRARAEEAVAPVHGRWGRDGIAAREVWICAGASGLLGTDMGERCGGGSVRDLRYPAVVDGEPMRSDATGRSSFPHDDVAGSCLRDRGAAGQKRR